MAPSGPPPNLAVKAAHRREPIILRGFSRRRQLDISFQTNPFGTVWLRGTYTNEHADHFTHRTRDEDFRLQEVRYGNNITVLLKAFYRLRRFYNTRDFWPAIATGFDASADGVRDMVELLADARSIYHRNNPDEKDVPPTGANLAADRWLSFLADQKHDSRTGRTTQNPEASSSEILKCAREFFNDSEGLQVDLANVLHKRPDRQYCSSSDSRKRFASPEPPGQAPSPKRRPSSNHFERPDTLSARKSQSLATLSTGISTRGSARQDSRTPISASDRPPCANSPSQSTPDVANKTFPKVCATTPQTENSLPATEGRISTPNSALSNGSLDVESHKMREKMASLEKELCMVKSRLSDDQHHRDLVSQILSEHGLIRNDGLPSTPDPAAKTMQAQITSLKAKLEGEAARHAQEIQSIKESIQIFKQQTSMLSNKLMKKETSASSNDWDASPGLPALKDIQGKLASIECMLLVHGTAKVQTKFAALESRIAIIQPQTSEARIPANQNVNDKSASSESIVVRTGVQEHGQVTVLDMLGKISRLEDGVSSISNRVTKIEAEPIGSEDICELESKVQIIEDQCDKDQKRYVTKHSLAHQFEKLESLLAQEKTDAPEQLQDIHLRVMATETQSSKPPKKTIDAPKTPHCPYPSQNVQRQVDEILKTIGNLPTKAYVTDMVAKREQVSKSENKKVCQSVADLSTGVGNLPTATLVSNMFDKRDQSHKSDIEKLRRNQNGMSTQINSLPNKAYISERLFRLEQCLRDELRRHQKDTDSVVDGTRKDLGNLQAQVKGLNKLWNEATTTTAKSDALIALKGEIETLKGGIAKQCTRMDDSTRGLKNSQEGKIAALERQVVDLSAQVRTTLSEVTLENPVRRLQEAPSEIAAQAAARDARLDNVVLQVEELHARDRMLAKALYDVGLLMQPA